VIIFDFFAGTGSSTQAFRDAGDTVYTFELDDYFDATENVDILTLSSDYLLRTYGQPDFIWASPPCTTFSVASIGHHWLQGGQNPIPRTSDAELGQRLVAHTRKLIEELNPTFGFLIENPRGMLRKLAVVDGLDRRTITYCQYGDKRMKPTDLWGSVTGWQPKNPCKNGAACHISAPRGSQTGTQGMKHSRLKSMIPYQLGEEIRRAIISS
jgi:hypothetical protein